MSPSTEGPNARHHHDVAAGPDHARAVVARVALLVLATAALYQGVWAQIAPHSFYEDFPGGMGWIATEGPFNEHLVRDIGGLVNGMAVVAIVAAWTLSRPVLLATALGWLVYGVPHLGFHLAHPVDGTSAQAVNVVVLTSEIVLPLLALLVASQRREPRAILSRHRDHAGVAGTR
jgi:hypothetical protein